MQYITIISKFLIEMKHIIQFGIRDRFIQTYDRMMHKSLKIEDLSIKLRLFMFSYVTTITNFLYQN